MSIDFSNEQEQTFDFDFLKVAEDVMETVWIRKDVPMNHRSAWFSQITKRFIKPIWNIVRSTGQRMCCLSLWLIFRHLQIILCWKTMTAALIRKVESFFWETS